MIRRWETCSLHPVLQSCILGLVALLSVLTMMPLQAHASSLRTNYVGSYYSMLGRPTVSVALINRVLFAYHSPSAGQGQVLYNDGVAYGIDPVYALAFFFEESTFGTAGVARVTHSLGNIRTPVIFNCRCRAYNGYRLYGSWNDGFLDWYQLIFYLYIHRWKLSTVDQIIPVYAPSTENNVGAYIATVKRAVNRWRLGYIIP